LATHSAGAISIRYDYFQIPLKSMDGNGHIGVVDCKREVEEGRHKCCWLQLGLKELSYFAYARSSRSGLAARKKYLLDILTMVQAGKKGQWEQDGSRSQNNHDEVTQ